MQRELDLFAPHEVEEDYSAILDCIFDVPEEIVRDYVKWREAQYSYELYLEQRKKQ